MPKPKKQRGRPPIRPMPERIDATPEEIAEAFLRLPPDYEWQYVKDAPAAYVKNSVDGDKDGE